MIDGIVIDGQTIDTIVMPNGEEIPIGGGVTPTGNIDITSAGTTDVTNYATATVPSASFFVVPMDDPLFYTEDGVRKWRYRATVEIDPNEGDNAGWIDEGLYFSEYNEMYAVPSNTSVTPTESSQTIGGMNVMMEGAVTVNAIPSTYVGSGIDRRDSTDLEASGATVSVPSGFYENNASKAIANGSATASATKGAVSNHSVTVTPSVTRTAGYVTAGTSSGTAVTVSASELVSGTYTVSASGTADITNYASLSVPSGSATPQSGISGLQATLSTGTNTLTLTQTIENTPAVTPGYISSGTTGNTILSLTASVNTRSSSDLTASNLTVTAPSGYYASNATKTLTDANLLATNIKKDVSIFGVTGTYEGSGIGGSDAHFGYVENTPDSANVLAFQLDGQPTSCFVYVKSSLTPISDVSQVSAIVWDGGDYIGDHYVQTITNTANAQVSYVNGGVYHSLSGDSPITITFYAGMGDDIAFADETYVCIYSYGSTSSVDTKTQSVGSGATSITFTGLTKTPQYFGCIFTSNFSTSSGYQRVIAVGEFEGDCYGLEMDSSAHYSNAHWSYSYSNGSLTITSQGTNAGGYFHQPGNYLLVYSYDNDTSFQTKTVTPTTSQQIIEADTGYLGLSSVTVNAIPSSYVQPTTTVGSTTYRASTSAQTIQSGTYHSAAATIAAVTQTNLTAANIKSGTTITISNGQSNLWSVTGTYEGEGGGGGTTAHVGTATITNSSASNTSISFSSLSGTPKAFFVRCTSQLTRSSNSSYYYVTSVRYNGTNTTGNYWRMSNGTFYNDTSHYSYTYSNGTLTIHSSASRSSAGGSFYNGGYELVYVYES